MLKTSDINSTTNLELITSKGKISYTKVGHGPHLSFLHGFCEDSRVWNLVVNQLKSDFTCLSIDLPGFGLSECSKPYLIEDLATIIKDVLEAENVQQTVLLGHSMGGYVGLEMLAQYSEKILGLGLIHSTTKADNDERKQNRRRTVNFIKNNGASPFLTEFIKGLCWSGQFQHLKSSLENLVNRNNAEAMIAATEAMIQRKDFSNLIANCNTPILYIIGDQDAYFSKTEMLSQASTAHLVQIEILRNCGHLSMIELPDDCANSIRRFVEFCTIINA